MWNKVDIQLQPEIQFLELKTKFEIVGNRKSVTIPKSCFANNNYVVEFSDPKGDWYLFLGFEKDYVELDEYVKANKDNQELTDKVDEAKSYLSFISKYRRSQKKVLYSKEEFNNLFEVMPCWQDNVAKHTKVYIQEEESYLNIKFVYSGKEKQIKGYKHSTLESEIQQEFKRFLNSTFQNGKLYL